MAIAATLVLGASAGLTVRPAAGEGPPNSNQQVLTLAESKKLVAWATHLQKCLPKQLGIDDLDVRRTRIEIPVASASSARQVVAAVLPCAERFGGPPRSTSVQGYKDRIVLYLPARCLLDKKVTRRRRV